MTMLENVIQRLTEKNVMFISKSINHGTQLVTADNAKINVYSTDKVWVQGKNSVVVKYNKILALTEEEYDYDCYNPEPEYNPDWKFEQ